MAKEAESFEYVADHIKGLYVEAFASELPDKDLDVLNKIENNIQYVDNSESIYALIMALMFTHITVQGLQNVKKDINDFMGMINDFTEMIEHHSILRGNGKKK